MRCKPGDLAVVVKSLDGNSGLLVNVLRDSGFRDSGSFWWLCETSGNYVDGRSGGRVRGGKLLCEDGDLRPIRDSDGADETLTWAGKPEKVTA